MNSQYVQITLPSNINIHLLVPFQQSILQQLQPCVPTQIRLFSSNSSVVIQPGIQSPFENNIPPQLPVFSLNTNQHTLDETSASMVTILSSQESSKILSSIEIASSENSLIQLGSILNTDSNLIENIQSLPLEKNMKRNYAQCNQVDKTLMKNSFIKNERQENCQRNRKRGKNWSEEETTTFINIWSDYYTNLISSGSRNICAYHLMAEQLTELLSPRVITGADVKIKISNLVAEYRKKKKEQGKVGGNSSSWRYFDQIDKFLGERPFNDESLTTDSISFQQEQRPKEIENTSVNDLAMDSIVGDNDNNIYKLMKEIEQSTNNSDKSSYTSKSSTNSTSKITNKRYVLSKKKGTTDMCIDLMQQMIDTIDAVHETVIKIDTKLLVLLEKQTKLQEESLNNEKEFLNVFRNIANNFNTSR